MEIYYIKGALLILNLAPLFKTYFFDSLKILNMCHEESPLIHPVGWARRVGHQVVANKDYYDRCAMDNLLSTDCTPDMFPEYRQAHMTNLVPGMLKK